VAASKVVNKVCLVNMVFSVVKESANSCTKTIRDPQQRQTRSQQIATGACRHTNKQLMESSSHWKLLWKVCGRPQIEKQNKPQIGQMRKPRDCLWSLGPFQALRAMDNGVGEPRAKWQVHTRPGRQDITWC